MVFLASLLIAGTASGLEPLDAPGSVDRIEYVSSSTTPAGNHWDLYRNLAYPCSISGYQTFVVGTDAGSDPAAPRPLWVRLRGGGVGYFNASGVPQPSVTNKTEEGLQGLIAVAENNGLSARISALPEGFRTVAVSMCSHDIFEGGDQTDPDNPNLTPDGGPRHTNGLFATKAAIRFVQEKYPTTRTFLHGTSAGSFGGYGVAWSLQLEDRPVSGFVADSGVTNPQFEADADAAGSPCARGDEALAAVALRIHPDLQGQNEAPRSLLAATSPLPSSTSGTRTTT